MYDQEFFFNAEIVVNVKWDNTYNRIEPGI